MIFFTADLMQLDECQRLSDYLEEKDIEIFYKTTQATVIAACLRRLI